MSTIELIKSICRERHIPISKLERDCDFANGYIGQLRKGSVPADRLYKISQYLGVPVVYLITGEPSDLYPSQAPAPTELQAIYDGLDDYDRETLMRVARALASKDSCGSRS